MSKIDYDIRLITDKKTKLYNFTGSNEEFLDRLNSFYKDEILSPSGNESFRIIFTSNNGEGIKNKDKIRQEMQIYVDQVNPNLEISEKQITDCCLDLSFNNPEQFTYNHHVSKE